MRKYICLIIIMYIICILPSCNSKPIAQVSDKYHVKRVVDGDTFIINYNVKDEYVRLIGINTPETVKPNSPVEYYGKEASNYTKSLIKGKYVKLEFDVEQRDKYGRLLAYVYLEDGKMLNKVLVGEGYAQVMTVPPNVKYADQFVALQRAARESKKGLWDK